MPEYAQSLTHLFAIGIVVLQLGLLASVMHRLVFAAWVPERVVPFVERYGLMVAAFFPVVALTLSLWYSEIVGLPVCVLCWLTRTVMYPLAIILPIAAWRGDREIWRYVVPLTAIGFIISSYQHLMQMGVVAGGLCHALSGNTDCAARYIFEFNYITFPLFGVTIFAVIALFVWLSRNK